MVMGPVRILQDMLDFMREVKLLKKVNVLARELRVEGEPQECSCCECLACFGKRSMMTASGDEPWFAWKF